MRNGDRCKEEQMEPGTPQRALLQTRSNGHVGLVPSLANLMLPLMQPNCKRVFAEYDTD